jgi:hypothetical protein
MNDYSDILEHKFHSPQRNFSDKIPRRNPEEEFAQKFTEAYYDNFLKIHIGTNKKNTLFMREVPISGNGIADLLVFNWAGDERRKSFLLTGFLNDIPIFRLYYSYTNGKPAVKSLSHICFQAVLLLHCQFVFGNPVGRTHGLAICLVHTSVSI